METIAWNDLNLIEQYNRLHSGHFFDKETMRFFRSRVTSHYKRLNDAEALFITTEAFQADAPRLATIRRAKLVSQVREDGRTIQKIKIETVGEFNKMTLAQAKKVLQNIK